MNKKLVICLVLGLILRLSLLPFFNFGDVNNSVIWGIWAKQFGLSGYYNFLNFFNYARPNQPPLTILLYDGLRYAYDFIFSIFWQLNVSIPAFPSQFITVFDKFGYIWVLKLPSIFADLGLSLIIYKLARFLKSKNPLTLMNLYLFNPISWYNSVVWGQTDSMVVLLGLGSILLVFFDFPILGVILFAITILFKATLLTFLPIIIVIFLVKKVPLKKCLLSTISFIITIWVISKPFAVGPALPWILNLYVNVISKGELPLLTANAFNFWNLLFGQSMVKDTIQFVGISASVLGGLLFVTFSIKPILDIYRKNKLENVLFSIVLITMAAFLFLTRMHERYLYPIFVPLIILASVNRRLIKFYIILSVLMLLNMYNGWWIPKAAILMNFVGNGVTQRLISVSFLIIFFLLNFKSRELLKK